MSNRDVFDKVACPKCGAPKGLPCVTLTGRKYQHAHGSRQRAFYKDPAAEPITLDKGDAMLVAAYLLSLYETRRAHYLRETAAGGAKAYEESMAVLGGLIVRFHPELAVNLPPQHGGLPR
jgi:hypothetical protein